LAAAGSAKFCKARGDFDVHFTQRKSMDADELSGINTRDDRTAGRASSRAKRLE